MITLLTKDDLIDNEIDMEDLSLYTNFNSRVPRESINKSDLIIFIDDDRDYMILKNRYADDSPETYGILDLLKLN